MTENSHTTAHRDRLAAFHARRGDHLATGAALMAAAEAGEEIDLAQIRAAEDAAEMISRLLPSATALAATEAHTEAMAVWAVTEAAALGDHHRLAADFHDKRDQARAAVADLVAASTRLNRSLGQYVENPTRPAGVFEGTHPVLAGEVRATACGERMHTAPTAATVAAIAAEAMTTVRASGEPVPTTTAEALAHLAADLVVPVDPRGTGDETTEATA